MVIDKTKIEKTIKTEKDAEGPLNFALLVFISNICEQLNLNNIKLLIYIDSSLRINYKIDVFQWIRNGINNPKHWKTSRKLLLKKIEISEKSKIVDSKKYFGVQFADFIANAVFKFKNQNQRFEDILNVCQRLTKKKLIIFDF